VWDLERHAPARDYPNTFTGDNVRLVLGMEPGDLATSSFFDRIHPDDRARATRELEMLLDRGRSVQEYRFLHGDGTYHWILDENLVVHEADGQPARIVGFLADVTDQHRRTDERLQLAAAVDQSSDGILLCGLDGVISFANAALATMVGVPVGQLVGMHTSALANNPALKPVYEASMEAGFAGRHWTGSVVVNWRGDHPYNLDASVWPLMTDGRVSSLLVTLRDVTAEYALTATLDRHTAERSAVAGAFARLRQVGTPEERAAVAVNELTRIDGVDVALMLAFPSGPGITRVAADGAFMGRDPWHFVDGCGAYLRRQLEAGRTLEDWSEHREAHEQPSCTWGRTGLRAVHLEPVASDGVVVGGIVVGSMAPNGRARLVELTPLIAEFGAMVAALVAPEVAKRRAIDGVRATIERVLADRAFHSVFQPAFDINAGTLVGYESLTRFTDGTRPDLRFAQGVAVGLGLELEVATMAAALAAAASLPAGCWLSLNASPELILEHRRLSSLLAGRGDRRIILEVTEHAAVADYGALREAVADLGRGVEIAVDDAGAGFASLRHVIELRPDYVKLDITLIRGVGDDDARRALVAGMVHFAAETGCLLVAEGIETEAELEALRQLGVGLGQGYLLGRPGPLPAVSV
jgi:PAS domain S-box-containing protein